MLTMPGVHWGFERQLLTLRDPKWLQKSSPEQTHFTGVENDRAIYFASAALMPGIKTPRALVKPVKRDKFPFAEIAIKTRYASFFFANVDDLMMHDWQPAPYRDIPAGWDAVWLDYTGPLSTERMRIIKSFYQRAVREILIVTVLKARWNRDTVTAIEKAGGHTEWLQQHLQGEMLHTLDYFDTSPMTQFAIRKEEK